MRKGCAKAVVYPYVSGLSFGQCLILTQDYGICLSQEMASIAGLTGRPQKLPQLAFSVATCMQLPLCQSLSFRQNQRNVPLSHCCRDISTLNIDTNTRCRPFLQLPFARYCSLAGSFMESFSLPGLRPFCDPEPPNSNFLNKVPCPMNKSPLDSSKLTIFVHHS